MMYYKPKAAITSPHQFCLHLGLYCLLLLVQKKKESELKLCFFKFFFLVGRQIAIA